MVRNRQYDLTPREEELMDMMWQANRPMSRAELRNMPVERSWKDNYLPVMLQALEKRGLIQVAGFVREGKTYARQFVPTWSKAELFAKSAAEHLEKDQLRLIFLKHKLQIRLDLLHIMQTDRLTCGR